MKSALRRLRAILWLLPAVLVAFAAGQATISATGNGNWGDSTTWTGGVVPGASDTASFSAVTLTLDNNYTVGALVFGAEGLITGANTVLTVSGPLTLDPGGANANEHLYAGTNSATITVNSLGPTDVFAFPNTQEGLWDNNTGTAIWNNQAGATFTLHDAAGIYGATGSQFTNAAGATFTHTGPGAALVQWTFVNHGVLNVAQGSLAFSGTTVTSDGTIGVASGATLNLSNTVLGAAATVSLAGGATLGLDSVGLGAGVVVKGEGNTTLADVINLQPGTVTLANAVWAPEATLTGTNSTLVVGGPLTLNPGGANANEHLYAGTNSATITVNSLGLTDVFAFPNTQEGLWDNNTGTAIWNNQAGATFTLHDAAGIYGATGSQFTNAAGATFTHTGPGAALVQWTFVNHGVLNVAQGSLAFSGTTVMSDGTIGVASGATLNLSNTVLGAAATVSLAGGATLGLDSVGLGAGVVVKGAGNTTLADVITLQPGTVTLANAVWAPEATLTGTNSTLEVGGPLTLDPGGANANEHLYAGTNSATITVNSLGPTDVFAFPNTQEGLWDNNTGTAIWNNQAGATFTLHDAAGIYGATGSVFTNTAGASFVHTESGSAQVQWAFSNAGSVEVQAGGTLTFQGPVAQDNGAGTLTGGSWIVDNGATLVFPGNPSFTTIGAGAAVALNGLTAVFTPANTIITNLGSFSLLGGQSFAVTPGSDFTNNGGLTVSGTGSALLVNGNFFNGTTGSGSLTVAAGGAVSLSGNLVLASGNGAAGTVNLNTNGVLQLGGSNGLQSGTGTATFNWTGGTLQVVGSDFTTAVGAALGGGTSSILDTNGFNATWSGVLSGAGGLMKQGGGTLSLSGVNLYMGGTAINAGTVVLIGAGNTIGASSGVTIASGGVLSVLHRETIAGLAGPAGSAVSLSSGAILTTGNAGNTEFDGVIAGPGGLTKQGLGTFTLSGINAYTGGTTVSGGILSLGSPGTLGSVLNGLTIVGGSLNLGGTTQTLSSLLLAGGAVAGGTLESTGSFTLISGTVSAVLAGSAGLAINGSGTVSLSGANSYAGVTSLNGGTLALISAGALGSTSTIHFNGGTLQFSATNTTDYSLRFSTAANQQYRIDSNGRTVTLASALTSVGGSLTKVGPGTLTLTNANNSYTGNTIVDGGVLALSTSGAGIGATNKFVVGNAGTGAFLISGNATTALTSSTSLIGNLPGSNGTVTASGGIFTTNNGLAVGNSGSGSLTINGSGNVTDTAGFVGGLEGGMEIGLNAGATGTVVVAGGTLTSNGMDVGASGNGSFQMTGGTATFGELDLGLAAGASGAATLSGGTLTTYGLTAVGSAGKGSLVIMGGTLSSGGLVIGNEAGSIGAVTLSAGTFSSGSIYIGSSAPLLSSTGVPNLIASSTASLAISGGVLTDNGVVIGEGGATTGSATATVTGGKWTSSFTYSVGYGSIGSLNLSAGTVSDQFAVVGEYFPPLATSSNSLGTVTVSGGLWASSFELFVGDGAIGVVTVAGTGSISSPLVQLATATASIGFFPAGNGTLDLNSTTSSRGVLLTSQILAGQGTSALNFNGGILRATRSQASFLSGFTTGDVQFLSGGAFIDTQTFSIGIPAAMAGVGGLTKMGAGTLTLSGANTYTGGTTLGHGTLDLGNAAALGLTGTITFNGGILQYGAGSATDYSSRFSSANTQAYNIDTNGQSATFGSALSSSGGFLTKFGAGTLTLTGANTYTGATTIASGTLLLTGLGSLGAGSYGGAISDAGSLNFAGLATQLLTGAISGPGALFQTGSGTLTLGGNNAQTGGTTVANGVVMLVGAGTLGAVTNALTVSGGLLDLGGTTQTVSSVTLSNGALSDGILTSGGFFALQGGTVSAALAGSGGLTKSTAGMATLSGPNTYTGGTIVSAGTLVLSGIGTLGSATGSLTIAGGATLDLTASTASISVGTLFDSGTLALGTNNLTIDFALANALAGIGNSYNPRSGITGTGAIDAAGSTAQAVTGPAVTGGTTAAPELGLGNIHVGDTVTTTYAIANTGSNGPSLSGAVQTAVNGGNISDPRLSGLGVSAANFGPVAAGAKAGSLGVTFIGSSAGAITGQSVAVVNEFSNVPDQVIDITGAVYAYAAASPLPGGVHFGNFHVGDIVQQAFMVSNAAAASGGFTENLAGAFGGASGAVMGGGSFGGVAPGGSSGALTMGLSTSTAGAVTGSATYDFSSQAVNGSGLGPTALAPQTVTASANVYAYAVASSLPSSLNLGIMHVGDAGSTNLSITNTAAPTGGFTENLGASFGPVAPGLTGTGFITGLAPGGSSTAMGLTLNTDAAGLVIAVPVIVNFTSQAVGGSGLGNTVLAGQTVAVTGQVNNYAAPAFSLVSGAAGSLTPLTSTTSVLNFGTLALGSGTVTLQLKLANAAAAPADSVDGVFGISNPSAEFFITGASNVTGLIPGAFEAFSVGILGGSQPGTYNAVLTFDGTGENSTGYAGSLGEYQLEITGTISTVPEPSTVALLTGLGVLGLVALRRRRSGRCD